MLSYFTLTSRRSEGSQSDPLYGFICNEKTASAKAKPLQVCKPCSSSHMLRPGAAMCQARSLRYRVILEGVFVAPAVFSAALCRCRHIFVSSRLKTSWSYFRPLMVIQVQYGSVIFAPDHFKSYEVCALFLPKTSYKNELKQCRRSHCVQLATTHRLRLRSPLDLKFTCPKIILWP